MPVTGRIPPASGLGTRWALPIWMALGCWCAALAAAQTPEPIGVEFQVNTYTTWYQWYSSVEYGPTGEFIVVWQDGTNSVAGDDGSRTGVKGQRFDPTGNRLGAEFQVNTYTTDWQYHPAVAIGPDGKFLVVWAGNGPDDPRGIWGRRYDSNGTALGAVFRINTHTLANQGRPDVDVDSQGRFIVAWRSSAGAGSDTDLTSVAAQMLNPDGSFTGTEFQVNTITGLHQGPPEVAMAPNGSFVVVYPSSRTPNNDYYPFTILATRFDAMGNPIGAEFQVNSFTPGSQLRPQVDMGPDGKFVVVWDTDTSPNGQDPYFHAVRGQRFNALGNPVGSEFQVNTTEVSAQFYADVAIGAGGNFIVAWTGYGPGSDPDVAIVAQGFDSRGVPVGGEFQVNTITTYNEYQQRIATDSRGNFVVSWTNYGSFGDDDSRYSVQARRYTFPPGLVFADGFGSGGTAGWSSTVSRNENEPLGHSGESLE